MIMMFVSKVKQERNTTNKKKEEMCFCITAKFDDVDENWWSISFRCFKNKNK